MTAYPQALDDNDYLLIAGAAWVEVKGFAIRVHTTDQGVEVKIYDNHLLNNSDGDTEDALLNKTRSFYNELVDTQADYT